MGVRGQMDMREWMGQEELKGETNGKEERVMDQKKVELVLALYLHYHRQAEVDSHP